MPRATFTSSDMIAIAIINACLGVLPHGSRPGNFLTEINRSFYPATTPAWNRVIDGSTDRGIPIETALNLTYRFNGFGLSAVSARVRMEWEQWVLPPFGSDQCKVTVVAEFQCTHTPDKGIVVVVVRAV